MINNEKLVSLCKQEELIKMGHLLGELVNDPLLLIDLIPEAGQLLVMEATVRLALLTNRLLEKKRATHNISSKMLTSAGKT